MPAPVNFNTIFFELTLNKRVWKYWWLYRNNDETVLYGCTSVTRIVEVNM